MMFRMLPLVTGAVPFVGIFVAYWMGAHTGVLPECVPFIDGCVSISATGRKPPGSFLFKAILLPQSALLFFVWYFCAKWLQALDADFSRSLARAIVISGIISAAALIVYVTFLGTKVPVYEFMRRFGIYFFFTGMAVCEVLVAKELIRIARQQERHRLEQYAKTLLLLCVLPFILGLLNLILKQLLDDDGSFENQIEWIASMLMHAYLVVLYFAWRDTGVGIHLRVQR